MGCQISHKQSDWEEVNGIQLDESSKRRARYKIGYLGKPYIKF
jgi:hypothetical protein